MTCFSIVTFLLALRLTIFASGFPASEDVPTNIAYTPQTAWWLAEIERNGAGSSGYANYKIFRNVKEFGAKGDGTTDDTDAINSAISQGSRCGKGCDSSTVRPALVYFPPGTYIISSPLVQLYYTQFIGDAISRPVLKASPNFTGMAVIDSDPYDSNGTNWYINQNNFFRQIRNFVIDITEMPFDKGACIHWQVAQATSLQNIEFNMRTDGKKSNKQMGIFMDNGSGGFMTDLTFNGGKYGAFFGNQQFTTRNLVFNNCQTAIFMNWNWLWTLSGVKINNAGIGIDMSNGGPSSQSVGSVLLTDSRMTNTPIGVLTAYSKEQGATNGTLVIDNVDFSENVPVAVSSSASNTTVLTGNTKIDSWVQGNVYKSSTRVGPVQDSQKSIQKPGNLLDANGNIFTRSKPQYEDVAASSIKSVKAAGAKGDGVSDDTAAIQALFDSVAPSDVVYFDHGAYIISSTVRVPKNIRITGEIWPLILASGSAFTDATKPVPVFQVGQPGDVGCVEMSDLVFETSGPQPGAVMIEWNVAQKFSGSAGMWDVHVRIGGTAGTKLQSDTCVKTNATTAANPACYGAFLLLHVTQKASIYLENNWFWVADHELDQSDHSQISLFNGRGVLIESADGPVWMYGTSSEHNVLYNYQITNAKSVYMALIQTETPYFQSNPDASQPYSPVSAYNDPVFKADSAANKAWGLRVMHSSDIFLFGGGLYSFFDNYEQTCIKTAECQTNMVSLEDSSNVYLYGLSTIASTNMITLNGAGVALDKDNRNNFCSSIARFSI